MNKAILRANCEFRIANSELRIPNCSLHLANTDIAAPHALSKQVKLCGYSQHGLHAIHHKAY